MYKALDLAYQQATSKDQIFEVETVQSNGAEVKAWKNAPSSLRDFWQACTPHGDKDYLIYEDERISYAQADAMIKRLCQWFKQQGIGQGDRVAIAMRNYPEWMLAYWAITSIGAEVVGMNAWWVSEEMEYAIKDSKPSLIIADIERLERMESIRGELPNVQVLAVRAADYKSKFPLHHWPQTQECEAVLPDVVIEPDDVACVFYTSGTTGFPKGAQLTHRNCCNNILSVAFLSASYDLAMAISKGEPAPQPDPNKEMAVILATPLFHVTANNCVAQAASLLGAKLIHLYKWDVKKALSIIESEKVTAFSGVPVMARELIMHPDFASTDTSTLETIGAGGAAVPPDLVGKIHGKDALIPGQGFGMTETAGMIAASKGAYLIDKPESVGRLLPIFEGKCVDADGKTLGVNGIGELYLKSSQIIKGYVNRPEATAESIQDGWLKSGDIGYFDEDGFLYLVDRAKDMVIRGGENIYSLEVEAALYKHPKVQECAVFAVPDERMGEEVGAAIYCGDDTLSTDELKEFCKGKISAFKIPRFVWQLDEPLPQNANGKFVKKELRKMLISD